MNNSELAKDEFFISQEDETLYEQIQKELFDEVAPNVFVKKEGPPVTDPNEACYNAISIYVYGFTEYNAKIGAVTDINYVYKKFNKSMLQESISTNSKLDIATDLVQRGIDVNIQDFHGNTALHYLTGYLYKPEVIKLFQLILDHGANVNLLNHKGISVFWSTVHCVGQKPSEDQRAIVKKMMDMGADKTILPARFQEWLEEILSDNNLF